MSSTDDQSARRPPAGPAALTRFIGREREVEEVHRLLAESRLLTLTGAGGSGKTRLAAEALERHLAESPVGSLWVELAPLSDPSLVAQRIAEALGAREELDAADPRRLAERIGPEPFLLVLDNCEHLVDACAALADAVLRAAPSLRILATSREALGVRGERAWLVPPLSLPPPRGDPEAIARSEAVRLFVDRARDALPGFEVTEWNAAAVAEICTRLDGIPLAIELAAARIRVLSPEQIRDRLDDAFRLLASSARATVPRHRTLRAAIQWSYDLLRPDPRELLARLSVFRGGFTLEGAEAVGGDTVLDGLERLVERSMVQAVAGGGAVRYSLLETIRTYARDRLEESGEAEDVHRAHALHMVSLAEAAAPRIFGGQGPPGWLEGIDVELANLRAAADWAESGGDPERAETAARLAVALQWYWFARGRFREGVGRLERVLGEEVPLAPHLRAQAAVVLFNLRFWLGEPEGGGEALVPAVEAFREAGDRNWLSLGLTALGVSGILGGDHAAAGAALDEAVELQRALPRGVPAVFVLYWHGLAAQARGDLEAARESFEEAIEIARAVGDLAASSHAMTVMGRLHLSEGDFEGARSALRDALAGHRSREDRWGAALTLEAIGRLALVEGRHEPAIRVLAAAEAVRSSIEAVLAPEDAAEHGRLLDEAEAAVGAPRAEALRAEGRGMDLEEAAEAAQEALGVGGEAPAERAAVAEARPATPPTEEGTRREEGGPLPRPAAAAQGLFVNALGPFEVTVDGAPIDEEGWSYARPRELLVLFLLHPRGMTRDEIGRALWPDATPPHVKNSFHVTLHHLRKRLGAPDWVVLEAERYRLNPGRTVEWDGSRFETGVGDALRRLRAGGGEPAAIASALSDALALYRGELLDGAGSGRWLEEARDRFRGLLVDGRLALGGLLLAGGDAAAAAEQYEAAVHVEEMNEEAHRGLMEAWAASGHRDRALRHYERLELLLRETLESAPEEETRELHRRLQGKAGGSRGEPRGQSEEGGATTEEGRGARGQSPPSKRTQPVRRYSSEWGERE